MDIAWKALLKCLIKNNEILFVDVTADWCVTCQFNKITTLNTKQVVDFLTKNQVFSPILQKFERLNIIRLKFMNFHNQTSGQIRTHPNPCEYVLEVVPTHPPNCTQIGLRQFCVTQLKEVRLLFFFEVFSPETPLRAWGGHSPSTPGYSGLGFAKGARRWACSGSTRYSGCGLGIRVDRPVTWRSCWIWE